MSNYFYRASNTLIRHNPPDIKKICVNYLIGERRGISDKGAISLQYIINKCGYSQHRGDGRINDIFKSLLYEMIDSGTLLLEEGYNFPPYRLSDAIPYIVNSDKFDVVNNFTKLTDSEFDVIIRNNPSRNRENLLALYLYVKSFYHHCTDGNRPIGFHQSLDIIKESIGISPRTAIGLFDELVDKELLFKYYVGSTIHFKGGKEIQENVPNIYIPNLSQLDDEIEETRQSTIDIMKDNYGVTEFLPFMRNLKEI